MEELTFEQKVELLRRAFDLVEQDEFLRLQHPEVEIRDSTRPDANAADGVYRDHDGVQRYVDDWMESWEEFHFTPLEFIDAGERLIVRVHASGKALASGIELENERFHVYGFRDGKIASWEFHTDEDAARESAS